MHRFDFQMGLEIDIKNNYWCQILFYIHNHISNINLFFAFMVFLCGQGQIDRQIEREKKKEEKEQKKSDWEREIETERKRELRDESRKGEIILRK